MKIADLFDVRGQATLVTGGASGIGRAMAEVMIDNGARVAILDRDEAALRPPPTTFASGARAR